MTLLNSNTMEDSDPQILAIQNMVAQLACCLKTEFKPYLPTLMESLVRDAKRDLDFKVVDAKEEELEESGEDKVAKDITQMMMQIKGMEG